MQATTTPKNTALKQGLTFGIALGVFDLILGAINTFGSLGTAGTIMTVIGTIVGILAYIFAGLRTAQATGRVGMGALAGLFTGLFAGIISAIGTIVFTIINVDALRQRSQDIANQVHLSIQYTNATVISAAIFAVIISVLVALGLGAGIGALGGLIGKNRAGTEVRAY